ncbi:MAG: Uma2 family endonuclease, partial [Chthoniobacterales bacterium]|nr:Uma2 family endonuclease [Chthoniobacterales bacterium]
MPIPDLIVGVLSESSEHLERGVKMTDYALQGLKNTGLWTPWRQRWRFLSFGARRREYPPTTCKAGKERVCSKVLAGLEFP